MKRQTQQLHLLNMILAEIAERAIWIINEADDFDGNIDDLISGCLEAIVSQGAPVNVHDNQTEEA